MALDLAPPDPADADPDSNDYVFERVVREVARDGTLSNRRIDLYKRGSFVLEAKQSRLKGGRKEVVGQNDLFVAEPVVRGRRGAERAWDVLMMNARQQAEEYVRLLPPGHSPPPFVIVCDVGHCFEIYANFRQDGKAYDQFPDRQSFRIYLEELRLPEIRARLAAIWTDPLSLDPARKSSRVTREIAERLAAVSKALEGARHSPEEVAMFLMRCLFTMFAEDIGLLPEKSFKRVLERCEEDPSKLAPMVGQLWEAMDEGKFAYAIEDKVRQFNGEFFRNRTVLALGREEIGELRQAASYDWRDVDPSIFGTLLEQALDPDERRRLGAHYTPRAYVERMVVATVIEPLRRDWEGVLSTAERQKAEGRATSAAETVRAFHRGLCAVRVLDPACGTGNFLYVALELLKRLEGEVLEALVDLGGQEALAGFEGLTVDPHQFLGLEINTRAAAIAELVLWIGHLQWHVRTKGGFPSEPILRKFKNIVVRDAVLASDQKLVSRPGPDGILREVVEYANPRRPEWPAAEFVVGNPPFIGSKYFRSRLGDGYAEALWSAHPHMNESADFVMYWWDRAADLLTRKGTILRRFGFVTTNSISQVFQRRVLEQRLRAKKPVSLVLAIPDHPWTKATREAAAVRIAMTVVEAGTQDGSLCEVVRETALDTDAPVIELTESKGKINPDLTIGIDVTTARALAANEGICSPGVKLHGSGFIVTPQEAELLGLGRRPGLERHIRPYRNGRDLTSRPRGVMVIDLFGLKAEDVRRRFPEVYQHLLAHVKPERDANNRASYRDAWWVFGEPRAEMRPALAGLKRFIVTPVTQKHRTFEFVSGEVLPDDALMTIAHSDAFCLGVLHSRFFSVWFAENSATLEDRPRFIKSRCFDPFPFPEASEGQRASIRQLAEELDAHRKRVLVEHPDLTMTGLYNVLGLLRQGRRLETLDNDDRRVFDAGVVLVLKELHDELDGAVAAAYGWPADAGDVLARLMELNRQRAREEADGVVRWLRPEYQIPRFATPKQKAQLDLGGIVPEQDGVRSSKPSFPADYVAQTAMVMAALSEASGPVDAATIAARFKQGRRVESKIAATLAAIARVGFIVPASGGSRFTLRRGG